MPCPSPPAEEASIAQDPHMTIQGKLTDEQCIHMHAVYFLICTSLVISPEGSTLCGRHGSVLEHKSLAQTLVRVFEPLTSMLQPGRPADLSALWLLRCAAELAAVWPGLEDSAQVHQGHKALHDPEGRWQVRGLYLRPLLAFLRQKYRVYLKCNNRACCEPSSRLGNHVSSV